MIRREFLKLLSLALVPWQAVKGLCFPPHVEYQPIPQWQVFEQHINGWDCSARYRIWEKHTPDSDRQVDLSWYKMSLDKERFAESPPPMFEVDVDNGLVRFREMTPEEYAVSLKEVSGEPVYSVAEDFRGAWSDTGLLL